MEAKAPNTIPSGIEPVDRLLGGLKNGQLYLVHGDEPARSLFGIKFLIEGLKRGENAALVIRYSPEDAVRRFARLGYDCLEDVYSGRLVILEYSDDIIQQIARLQALAPVLRELEWLLGETRPHRLVFDPVTQLVVGEQGDLEARITEFTTWASSFGATVALVADGDSREVIEYLRPLVEESFRFEVKEGAGRTMRFLAFEKSPTIKPQAIEVDPSRGVFLAGRAQTQEHLRPALEVEKPSAAPYDSAQTKDRTTTELPPLTAVIKPEPSETTPAPDLTDLVEAPAAQRGSDLLDLTSELDVPTEPDISALDNSSDRPHKVTSTLAAPSQPPGQTRPETPKDQMTRGQRDVLSDLLDDLAGPPSALDLDMFGAESVAGPASQPTTKEAPPDTHTEGPTPRPEGRAGAAETDVDSVITSRVVEVLLRPPESAPEASIPGAPHAVSQKEIHTHEAINPKDFNILVIDDDQAYCASIAQALEEYTVETVYDGVSGLAKLISFKPDLVILDVDLPIVDGFKVLGHIRSSLNMPIIIVSASRVRASDRLLSAELGADYYLTKPFSVKELRQKARQLIARYRGISSWIINSLATYEMTAAPASPPINQPAPTDAADEHRAIENARFVPYKEFTAQIERSVKAAIDGGASFSIVGCRLQNMTARGGRIAIQLFDMVRSLVRDTDLISTNPRNDLVILLADAEAVGARAFINRLRERILNEMNQEPSIWMRTFPDLEATESTPGHETTGSVYFNRRAYDKPEQTSPPPSTGQEANERPPSNATHREASQKRDPRKSYIDFLEKL